MVQCFARVDVADAGDQPLIEQQNLHRHALSRARARQYQRVERLVQRLWPHPAQRRVVMVGVNQIHQPEATRIVERHDHARRQGDDDVVVRIGGRQDARRGTPPFGAKRAGHAEVNEERVAGAERREQVLATTADRLDGVAGQPGDEIGWKRPPQIRSAELDAIDARATRRALEHPANGFDFREFRHAWILPITEGAENTEYLKRRALRLIDRASLDYAGDAAECGAVLAAIICFSRSPSTDSTSRSSSASARTAGRSRSMI